MSELIQTYNRIERDIKWLLNEIKKPDAWQILAENGKKLDTLSWKLKHPDSGYNIEETKKEMAKLTDEYKVALESAKVVCWLSNLCEEANSVLRGYKAESQSNGWYSY